MTKNGVAAGVVNILGKVTTLTHKTVQTFEDTVAVEQPAELLEKSLDSQSVYWKAFRCFLVCTVWTSRSRT